MSNLLIQKRPQRGGYDIIHQQELWGPWGGGGEQIRERKESSSNKSFRVLLPLPLFPSLFMNSILISPSDKNRTGSGVLSFASSCHIVSLVTFTLKRNVTLCPLLIFFRPFSSTLGVKTQETKRILIFPSMVVDIKRRKSERGQSSSLFRRFKLRF